MAEEGYTNDDVAKLLNDIANKNVLQKDELDKLKNLSADELFNIDPSLFISPQNLENAWFRKQYPVTNFMRQNQRALQIMEMMRGNKSPETNLPKDFNP
jgi:hypothetical protein